MADLFLLLTGRIQIDEKAISAADSVVCSGDFCVCVIFFAFMPDLWKCCVQYAIVHIQERVSEPGN